MYSDFRLDCRMLGDFIRVLRGVIKVWVDGGDGKLGIGRSTFFEINRTPVCVGVSLFSWVVVFVFYMIGVLRVRFRIIRLWILVDTMVSNVIHIFV